MNEIVIARYNENLDWISRIPVSYDVIIYNIGPEINSRVALDRANRIERLVNSGRESDTILRHVLNKNDHTDGYTVFLQGNPFEHSPDIIELLSECGHWEEIQPLSWRWVSARNLPPPDILRRETKEFIQGARLRSDLFSLSSWCPVQFFDPGAKVMGDWYRDLHGLPEGINIAAHFLRRCGWEKVAQAAECCMIGRFSYGALFAVRQPKLAQLQQYGLELALAAANGHQVYGYILERLWLHICGEPFLLSAQHAMNEPEDLANVAQRFKPAAPSRSTYQKVVPAIKRRVLHWAQN